MPRESSKARVPGKVYIGDLGNNAVDEEIEGTFRKFGRITNLFIAKRPPGFAFVEYESERDAERAVENMDGRYLLALSRAVAEANLAGSTHHCIAVKSNMSAYSLHVIIT